MFKNVLILFASYFIIIFFVHWRVTSLLCGGSVCLEPPILHMSGAEVLSYEDTFDRVLFHFELKYDENDSPTLVFHYGDKGTFPEPSSRDVSNTERLNIHNHLGRARVPLSREFRFLNDNDEPIKNQR